MLGIVNTWNLAYTVMVLALILFGILFIWVGYKFGKGVDEFFDSPKINIPDLINIEIEVKNPEKLIDAQNVSSVNPGTSEALTKSARKSRTPRL